MFGAHDSYLYTITKETEKIFINQVETLVNPKVIAKGNSHSKNLWQIATAKTHDKLAAAFCK